MAGVSHDVLAQALRDDPSLLRSLLLKTVNRDLPGPLQPLDSTVRFSRSAEMRPDVVARTGDTWIACEVQNRCDPAKGRRWLLGTAALHDGSRAMGELVIITASSRVARWARRVAHVTGPIGTSLRLSPLVLLLDEDTVKRLFDPTMPELALCAAWAMQRRHGRKAEHIVDRALEMTEELPEPLRTAQVRAIFSVLSKELRARLEKIMLNPDHIPESRAHRRLRLLLEAAGEKRGRVEGRVEGETAGAAKGRAESLLLVLETRGLSITEPQRTLIRECHEAGRLDTWLRRALTATSTAEVLASKANGNGSK